MQHVSRRRVLGGEIVLAGATAPAFATMAPSPPPMLASLAGTATPVLALVLVLGALLFGACWTWPHAQRVVRGLRARQLRQHARHRIEQRRRRGRAYEPATARRLLVVTVCGVLAVAGVALALNYAHGRDVARYNAETGWRAWLYPLTADGLLIVASLVLVWQLCRHGRTTWDARIAFTIGILASGGTNVLAALHADLGGLALVERITWTVWPTVGLLAAHEMLLRFLREYAAADPAHDETTRSGHQDAQQRTADAEARANELAAQLQQERQDYAAGVDTLRTELERARAELAEVDEHDQDPADADFEAIRAHVAGWIREQLDQGREVRTSDVPRVFRASLRWAQKHVPTLLAEARQSDTHSLELARSS